MAVQVDGEALTAGVLLRAGGVVTQQIERLTRRNSSVECLVHGVVGGFADLGEVGLGNTERTVTVLSDRRIFGHILGGVLLKRTAGDLDGGLGSIVGEFQTAAIGVGAQRAGDSAAGDADLGHLVLGAAVVHRYHVTVDGAAADLQIALVPAAVRPGRHCAVDRAALDGSSVPVLNGVAIGGVQRAAVQEQIAAIDLDHDEVVLRKRAALDIQAGVIGDTVIAHAHQGRALPAVVAAAIFDSSALKDYPGIALNVDDIVGGNAGVLRGILAHDRAGLRLAGVLDRHGACSDRQSGLALFSAAVEGMTVQVKRQPLGDGDVLLGIRQHRHGRISTGRIDGSLQRLVSRLVSRLADLRDICRAGFAACTFAAAFTAGFAALGAVCACTAGFCACGCRTRAFTCFFTRRPCACAQAQRHDQRQNGC